jgi:ferredoxin-NADP reductase
MHTLVSIISGSLFVLLGGLNVWIMLTNRSSSKRNGRLWMRVHRTVGYVFIAVFTITLYFMFMRIKGDSDELPPRILLHMSMALILAPLLVAKVLVARYQPGSRGLLSALGITIFAISFALVVMNIASFLLRNAKSDAVSPVISSVFVLVVSAAIGTLLLRRPASDVSSVTTKVTEFSRDGLTKVAATQNRPVITLRLSRVERHTHDSKSLRFVMPQSERFSARPGQFLTFQWTIDGKEVFRSYSICSSPTQTGYVEIIPKRVPNGYVSVFLNDRALPGLTVKARGPYGQFCFDETKYQRVVLIAAGSGITPIMSMLRYIDDLCISVDVTLIYCVRTQADVFFKTELTDLQNRIKTFRYVQVLSQPDPHWRGLGGRLTRELMEREIANLASSTFFLCGPPPFMDHTRQLLESLQVDRSTILEESFGGPPDTSQAGLVAEPAQVEFVRAGITCNLSPEETVLEVAEMNAVSIPYGCRQGSCGTCATRLLSGTVRMEREQGLSEDLKAQGYILPCVSRALGDIKLDT